MIKELLRHELLDAVYVSIRMNYTEVRAVEVPEPRPLFCHGTPDAEHQGILID